MKYRIKIEVLTTPPTKDSYSGYTEIYEQITEDLMVPELVAAINGKQFKYAKVPIV